MASRAQSFFRRMGGVQGSDTAIVVSVVLVVFLVIVPLPSFLLDLLMSLNFALSLTILLIVLLNRDPLDFSSFPTVLLLSTIYGLALNIASTRLILSHGASFNGHVVRAFATFVVGSTGTAGVVIGFIIFIILVVMQFLVVTKGSGRIAEVAARFALDAMPGKQMAIDQEFSSGVISEDDMRRRKDNLQRSVDFYGAMDGAGKFVSGNVKVGIVITVINLVGGSIIGMLLLGESFNVAMSTYFRLTIGDGLVSQIPTLIISVSTGLVVTRSISLGSFGEEAVTQFTAQSRVYWIVGALFAVMGVLPGFPWYIFLPMAFLLGYLGLRLSRRDKREAIAEEEKKKEAESAKRKEADPTFVPPLDPISLEIGYALIALVDKDKGAELLERIVRIRKETAINYGFVVPKVRILDNIELTAGGYAIKIQGVSMGHGEIRIGSFLAINPSGEEHPELTGEKTVDPSFGLPALWISESSRSSAERAGLTVVDPPSVIATHLTEIIKRHSALLLGRQEVRALLDGLKEKAPAVVEEAEKALSLGEIQKVLQGLLLENISIRNLGKILEVLSDYGSLTKEVPYLIEKSRQGLRAQISRQFAPDGQLEAITLDPQAEQAFIDSRVQSPDSISLALTPDFRQKFLAQMRQTLSQIDSSYMPVVLCSEAARPLVSYLISKEIPDLAVLSAQELDDSVSVTIVSQVGVLENA